MLVTCSWEAKMGGSREGIQNQSQPQSKTLRPHLEQNKTKSLTWSPNKKCTNYSGNLIQFSHNNYLKNSSKIQSEIHSSRTATSFLA
jgi:hypothetical protein